MKLNTRNSFFLNSQYLHHGTQIALFSSISYIFIPFFSSLDTRFTITFVSVAYTLHHSLKPFFAKQLELLQNSGTRAKVSTLSLHVTVIVLSKIICHILREPISFSQIGRVIVIYLTIIWILSIIKHNVRDWVSSRKRTFTRILSG